MPCTAASRLLPTLPASSKALACSVADKSGACLLFGCKKFSRLSKRTSNIEILFKLLFELLFKILFGLLFQLFGFEIFALLLGLLMAL